jgi:hypothetical protein
MAKINSRYNLQAISDFAGIVIIMLMAIIAPFFGGYDYKAAYRGDILTGTFGNLTFFPYPAYWFFFPFVMLPEMVGYFIWNIANALCFIFAIRYWKGNYLAFAFFIGAFWTFYGGQIEGFMAGALVLLMLPNPWLSGLGITILSFKPQIGLFPIVYLLLNKRDWKLLVVPSIIYIASFLYWGWWVPDWLSHLQSIREASKILVTMVSLFPFGLVLLPLLWRYQTSLKIWMYVQSLVLPYFPIYSLAPLFTISPPPWWINILIWVFYLSLSRFLVLSKFGFVFPLALLVYEIWKFERAKKSIVPDASESG